MGPEGKPTRSTSTTDGAWSVGRSESGSMAGPTKLRGVGAEFTARAKSLANPNTSLTVYRSIIKTRSKGGHRAIPNEDGSDNRLVSKPRSKLRCIAMSKVCPSSNYQTNLNLAPSALLPNFGNNQPGRNQQCDRQFAIKASPLILGSWRSAVETPSDDTT